MPGGDDDSHVQTTDEAISKINDKVEQCLGCMRQEYGTQGVSNDMVEYCRKYAKPIIKGFAQRNRDGETEATVLVEKWVLEHRTTIWTKECQASVEIDADEANAKLKQQGHIGCEIYFANKERCIEKTKEDWKAGKRILKTHAYLPENVNPPHYRHEDRRSGQDPLLEPARTTPEQADAGDDLRIMYRCTVTRRGFSS